MQDNRWTIRPPFKIPNENIHEIPWEYSNML